MFLTVQVVDPGEFCLTPPTGCFPETFFISGFGLSHAFVHVAFLFDAVFLNYRSYDFLKRDCFISCCVLQ